MFTVFATAAHLVAFNGAAAVVRADEREDTYAANEDSRLGSWITKTGG